MKIVVLLILGVALAGAAEAADAGTNGRIQEATELLKLMGTQKAIGATEEAMADAMAAGNPMLGPYRDVIVQWAGKYLTLDAIGPRVAALYANAFTEAELRDLIKFYSTPTGRKAIAVLPQIGKESAAIGVDIAREHVSELQEMIKARAAELEKLSHSAH